MSLSSIKQEILETLLLNDKPMKATDVAKDIGKEFRPVMMHILGLSRMGYVNSPDKGQYVITQKGKEAIGLPEINKEKAAAILAYAPHDKAFAFYAEVGKPLNMHAHNLRDFANKLERVDASSIQFHMNRGDFEAWFKGLGDGELVIKVELMKKRNITGEDARKQLREIVFQRYIALATLAEQPIYTD